MIFVPESSTLDHFSFDLITLILVALLLFLSLLSLSFIFYLCFRSRSSRHLQRFNSLWAVRLILVLFITFWSIDELLRLPFVRRSLLLFPFFRQLTLPQQADLCRAQFVISLGFLEPGFLSTLLFLLNVSLNKTTAPRLSWAIAFILLSCFPVVILQLFVVQFPRFEYDLPEVFHRSSMVVKGQYYEEDEAVVCVYPLLGTFVFALFGAVYSLLFMLNCWKLLSLVINKSLRIRIYALTTTVLVTLPTEIFFLGLSILWPPDTFLFGVTALVIVLSTFVCAAVGEGILVIRPISDWLAVEGNDLRWSWRRRSAR